MTQDNSSIASKLQGFVDAYNKVQSALDSAPAAA
jgi:flagellar hook-associated protein 2